MAANKEWAAEYMNKCYKSGEGMPYNEKFGITKAEYDEIKNSDRYEICDFRGRHDFVHGGVKQPTLEFFR